MSDPISATGPAAPLSETSPASITEKLAISGMHCAACVQLIEFRLQQLPGIASFRIQPATHTASVRYDGQRLDLRDILNAIVSLGYGAYPAGQEADEQVRRQNRMALLRIFISGFAMMQVMMFAWPSYLVPNPTADGELTPDQDLLLKLASLAISVPVVFFCALPFFKSAWRDLKHKHIGMDVPVSLGILLTFFASVWTTFRGGAVYYDSAIMFVFLLLGARWIEQRVQHKATRALRILTQLQPVQARKLPDYPASSREELQDARALNAGDVLLVLPGDQIPADGIILDGDSACDEALMTGESHPVAKQSGDQVTAGSINIQGRLVMRAEQTGHATRLGHLISMMENAASEKPGIVLLADRHASRFLMIIMLVALISGLVWWQIQPERALWIAISVIVVTCPCALSLATPGVMAAAIGLMARNGLLVKSGKALQGLAQATHIVFDKTGTLTNGKLQVQAVTTDGDASTILPLALGMAASSHHPVARSVADYLIAQQNHQAAPLQQIYEIAGGGIEAVIDGQVYRFGQASFVAELLGGEPVIPAEWQGKTVSLLANAERVLAAFLLQDQLRDDAVEALQQLRAAGKQICLLSGDQPEPVARIAAQTGITEVHAQMSPEAKFAWVQNLQRQGARVVMVGDGMNDGPVLAIADVAVAMGQGAAISQTRSDLLLVSNRLPDLSYGVRAAGVSFRLIRENLGWAILYNLVAIPAAVIGWLEPWHAALGMSLSSLIVVLNALRLYLLSQPEYQLTDDATE